MIYMTEYIIPELEIDVQHVISWDLLYLYSLSLKVIWYKKPLVYAKNKRLVWSAAFYYSTLGKVKIM